MTQRRSTEIVGETAAPTDVIEQRLVKRSHLYHLADVDDLYSILRHGIQPSETSHRDTVEAALPEVAEQFNLDVPVDRQACVFLYPRVQQALESVPTTDPPDGWASLVGSQSIIAVDGARVDQPLYIGEFQLISDAIDFQYLAEPDDAMISVSFEDALRRYAATLTPLDSLAALPALCDEYETPEVVVEGRIKPEAIIGWESYSATEQR